MPISALIFVDLLLNFPTVSQCSVVNAFYFVPSDFAEPLSLPTKDVNKCESSVDEDAITMIISMGFTRPQAVKALKATVSTSNAIINLRI